MRRRDALALAADRRASVEIGQRLLRLRHGQGLSQRDIAGPGCSAAYISRIEKGERLPSERALRHLAGRLGTTARYLETGRTTGRCEHCGRR